MTKKAKTRVEKNKKILEKRKTRSSKYKKTIPKIKVNVYRKLKNEKRRKLENAISQLKAEKEKKLLQKKRKLKKKVQKIIRFLLLVFFLSTFLYSSYKLLHFNQELKGIEEEKEKLIEEYIEMPKEEPTENNETPEEKIEDMKIDFPKLKSVNSEVVGWMVFNNKYVNNPIMHTTDNEYYLHHSFKRLENSVGSIFMDYRNTSFKDQNVVIFGHHTPNTTMFGSLSDVFKPDFFAKENADIIYIFDTNHELHKYQIFSYYVIEAEEYYITTSFATQEEFGQFLSTISRRSFGFRGISVTTSDHILTLSTCAGPSGTTKRRVIHAKQMT